MSDLKEKLKQTAMELLKQIIRQWNKFEERKDTRHLQTLETLRDKARQPRVVPSDTQEEPQEPPEESFPFVTDEAKMLYRLGRALQKDQVEALQQGLKEFGQVASGAVTDTEFERLQDGFVKLLALVQEHLALESSPMLKQTRGFLVQILDSLKEFRVEFQQNRVLFAALTAQLRKMEHATVDLQRGG